MKYTNLIMLVLAFQATADVSCYTYGNITNCSNGTSAYQYGNMTQIVPGNGQPVINAYTFGNQTRVQTPTQQLLPPVMPIVQPLEMPQFNQW